jgi:hypothetical protein
MAAEHPGEALKEMVELAKTRGGHDNITGVAVHVADLVESATPEKVSDDSTQPVDITGNPFASDEPTMTAPNPTTAAAAPATAVSNKPQPMRIVDAGTAPTVPPPLRGDKKIDWSAKTDPKGDKLEDDLADSPTDIAPKPPKPPDDSKD